MRLTIRARTALLCAGLAIAAGGVTLTGVLALLQHTLHVHRVVAPVSGYSTDADELRSQTFQLLGRASELQSSTIHDVRRDGLIGLGGLALVSVGLGWWVSGRMLRPATRLARAVGQVSATTLDQRFRSTGPSDELKEIADAFDGMLDRLDEAFDRQTRFVADVSHELRTPFAVMRASVDVALDDDESSEPALRQILASLGTSLDRGSALVDAMLALARAESVQHAARLDLAELASESVTSLPGVNDLELRLDLEAAPTVGDPVLLGQLVDNLIANAVVHNRPGGLLCIRTGRDGSTAVLHVENDGPHLDPAEVPRLLDRFHRADSRNRAAGGFGIGLSIVETITHSHRGELRLAARPRGGLSVSVRLPANSHA